MDIVNMDVVTSSPKGRRGREGLTDSSSNKENPWLYPFMFGLWNLAFSQVLTLCASCWTRHRAPVERNIYNVILHYYEIGDTIGLSFRPSCSVILFGEETIKTKCVYIEIISKFYNNSDTPGSGGQLQTWYQCRHPKPYLTSKQTFPWAHTTSRVALDIKENQNTDV
jgi:hypothetical protein